MHRIKVLGPQREERGRREVSSAQGM
jgi:hypothetical protein